MSLINVSNVQKAYGTVEVLRDITLDIEQGEFVALLGPSGCGKTTLLRAIAGFVDPDAGDITIGGISMATVPPNKRPVNMVFQNFALFPHLSVFENVAFGPRRRGLRGAKVTAKVTGALELVGMTEYVDRRPSQLSGGQQQRIALARAIANDPQVLLLDEPLGALDLKLRKRMQLELKHLQQQLGITFLFVTHDQQEALVMADRIVVMHNGRIAQVGTGRQIYSEPSTRYVANFIGEANMLPCTAASGTLRLAKDDIALPYDVPAAADDLTLLVRPEDVAVGRVDRRDDDVTIQVRVRETVFLGDAIRVYTETPGGNTIISQTAWSRTGAEPTPGQELSVSWSRASGRVLSA